MTTTDLFLSSSAFDEDMHWISYHRVLQEYSSGWLRKEKERMTQYDSSSSTAINSSTANWIENRIIIEGNNNNHEDDFEEDELCRMMTTAPALFGQQQRQTRVEDKPTQLLRSERIQSHTRWDDVVKSAGTATTAEENQDSVLPRSNERALWLAQQDELEFYHQQESTT